jgi:hypothetical protein
LVSPLVFKERLKRRKAPTLATATVEAVEAVVVVAAHLEEVVEAAVEDSAEIVEDLVVVAVAVEDSAVVAAHLEEETVVAAEVVEDSVVAAHLEEVVEEDTAVFKERNLKQKNSRNKHPSSFFVNTFLHINNIYIYFIWKVRH